MPAKTYLQQVGGRLKQIAATVVSTGSANGGDIVGLGDDGKLHQSLLPDGFAPATWTGIASETIAAGRLVNIWSDTSGGTPVAKARLADASAAGKRAWGYTQQGAASGGTVTVWFGGANSSVSGLTAGADVFLSASTPGGVTSTAPTGASQVVQRVGVAGSATAFMFAAGLEIELAPAAA
ncbi:hypothetical protein [Kineosporia sp. NBRC 101731]|uniref:hypothetical protein n=1 Tax=Kineosporia sp. NBRC 101731 TaxID=3032199 RepID=UPI0024A54046|nr:hypothetical protein [Kineosporia sp. NBRC 101731]GLY32127.1 hypothetical protein Kisp02_54920 [Kineosporia sp. NBRC 101731]